MNRYTVDSTAQELTRIEIRKEALHFSCAHFTIFSATSRENLHGHNYRVQACALGAINDNGLCFDYNILKSVLASYCDQLDEHTLVPSQSPYLRVAEDNNHVRLTFADDYMLLSKRDVILMDVRNITVEELARWFLRQLLQDSRFVDLPIEEFTLSLASGPSERASVSWRKL